MGTRNIQESVHNNRDSRDPYQALLNLNGRYSYMGTDDELEEAQVDTRVEIVSEKKKSSLLIVDPFGHVYHYWLLIVSLAVVYNLYLIIGRAVFWQLENVNPTLWFVLDYVCDGIYVLDIIVHIMTGYLNNDGILETAVSKTFKHYTKSTTFVLDVFSILPTDVLYVVTGTSCTKMICPTIFRLNRLARIPRLREFFYITELRTRFFMLVRILEMTLYILIIIHWNGCFFFAMSYNVGFGSDEWVFPAIEGNNGSLKDQYIYCMYWSTKVLLTLDANSPPSRNEEYIFMIFEKFLSVIIFAAILGSVTSIISQSYSRRNDFQNKITDLKDFFRRHKVNRKLQAKILKWCNYMYRTNQPLRQNEIIGHLQEELQAQIVRSMNREILQSVHLFKGANETFINEVCLKFRHKVYCPGDYVCHKGDIGKEMFILKSGQLMVEDSDDGQDGIYTRELHATKCFGDLCLIEGYGKKHGYRRMASVRSVGYSELLCLSKKDLGDVLDEYGELKSELIQRSKLKLMKLGLGEDPTSPSADLSQNRLFY